MCVCAYCIYDFIVCYHMVCISSRPYAITSVDMDITCGLRYLWCALFATCKHAFLFLMLAVMTR